MNTHPAAGQWTDLLNLLAAMGHKHKQRSKGSHSMCTLLRECSKARPCPMLSIASAQTHPRTALPITQISHWADEQGLKGSLEVHDVARVQERQALRHVQGDERTQTLPCMCSHKLSLLHEAQQILEGSLEVHDVARVQEGKALRDIEGNARAQSLPGEAPVALAQQAEQVAAVHELRDEHRALAALHSKSCSEEAVL